MAQAGERRGASPPGEQPRWRRQLQAAYEQPTYAQARAALRRLETELRLRSLSAAQSLAEGLEETLTLHGLGLFRELGQSLRTANPLESIMARVEQRTGKVNHWRTSAQKQRWCAAALLLLEPQLRKVKGYRHLPRLLAALRAANGLRWTSRRRPHTEVPPEFQLGMGLTLQIEHTDVHGVPPWYS